MFKCGQRELDLVKNYTGHDYDQVLGLYYAKARMYDPADRRFISMDPVKGNVMEPMTMVQYIYCINNPLIYVDPLGLCWFDINGNWSHDSWEYSGGYQIKDNPKNYVLKKGSKGYAVTELQKLLEKYGYLDSSGIDGSFGPKTDEAVRVFQANNSLSVDGSVGPQTWNRLLSNSVVKAKESTVTSKVSYPYGYVIFNKGIPAQETTYAIHVPQLSGGSNSNPIPKGYTKRNEQSTVWTDVSWAKVLAGANLEGDDNNAKGSALGSIASMISGISESINVMYLKYTTSVKTGEGKYAITLEFGMDIPTAEMYAGYYFYLIACSKDIMTGYPASSSWIKRNQESFAKLLGYKGERMDLKIAFDSARKTDKYFFYLYVDQRGVWKANYKKYSGDSSSIVRVISNGWFSSPTYEHVSDSGHFSGTYDVDQPIIDKFLEFLPERTKIYAAV